MSDEPNSLPEDERVDEFDSLYNLELHEGDLPAPEPGHPFTTIDRGYSQQSFPERILPHSKDVEVALLSAVLRNNSTLDDGAVARLKQEDFYRDAHRRIFKAMRALRERNTPIDFATLVAELEKSCELDEVGGRIYLRAILDYPQTNAVATHAEIIRDKKHLRDLIFALNKCLVKAYESEDSVHKIYGETLRRIWDLGPLFFD